MPNKEFNLLRESWILVMKQDGTTGEVSILDAFRHAHEYRSLAGELPTQDVAVLRLLIAILHVVFGRYDIKGNLDPLCDAENSDSAVDRWANLWKLGQLPMEPIESYLNKWEDRFYLFHPETPFYQVAALAKDKTVFGPFNMAKMNGDILEGAGKPRLFSSRTGEQKETLSYSEAIRWLLHMICYAEDFGKLEAKCKTSKNDPSVGTGWVGKIGSVMAQGKSLYETLLLNLVLLKDGDSVWGPETPVWERDPAQPVKERNAIICPDNPSGYLTHLPRQVLLYKKDNLVNEYVFLSGSFFPKENSFSEQFTIWRYTKDPGDTQAQFRPKTFDSDRQVWRGFETFVVQKEGARKPGIVSWLTLLREQKVLKTALIRFATSSPQYGTMSSLIADYAFDSLAFNPNLLTSLGKEWCNKVIDEIDTTENLVQQLIWLAQNIEKSSGSESGDCARDEARRQAYYELDLPFRKWLEEIDPEKDDISESSEKWWKIAQSIIRRLGHEIAESASTKSFIGRADSNDKIKPMSSSEAYNLFLYKTSSRTALISRRR